MLPFDHKPWARPLAAAVIGLSLLGAVLLTMYLRNVGSLHIPEVVGIFLLLLTIIPPNAAIVMHKTEGGCSHDPAASLAKTTTIQPS